MQLLAAIDASKPSQEVLREITARPWPRGTTVCILHVIDWSSLPSSAPLIQLIRKSAKTLVDSAQEKLRTAGISATAHVIEGHPRVTIPEYAAQLGCDLVLVGSHGASGVARFLLGSVAQGVLRQSLCSVEIVRKPLLETRDPQPPIKILAATDGSDCAIAAVQWIAEQPWPAGTVVLPISAVPVPDRSKEMISPTFAPVFAPPGVFASVTNELRRGAEEAVARARDVLTQVKIGLAEADSVLLGDAREILIDQAKAWGADLIVVGSHGYHGLNRFMLGSVSETVATHAHCSVAVIRTKIPPDH